MREGGDYFDRPTWERQKSELMQASLKTRIRFTLWKRRTLLWNTGCFLFTLIKVLHNVANFEDFNSVNISNLEQYIINIKWEAPFKRITLDRFCFAVSCVFKRSSLFQKYSLRECSFAGDLEKNFDVRVKTNWYLKFPQSGKNDSKIRLKLLLLKSIRQNDLFLIYRSWLNSKPKQIVKICIFGKDW